MKIILAKDVESLGKAGEIVRVKDGYARNYLIPRGFGFPANEKNVKELEFHRRIIEKKIDSENFMANETAAKLAECEVKIQKKVGEEGKLFGSVTSREIEEALKEKGFDIDHRNILIDGNIKKSGVYEVEVKLFRGIKGAFKLWVVAEDSGEVFEPETTVPDDSEEADVLPESKEDDVSGTDPSDIEDSEEMSAFEEVEDNEETEK